MLEFNNIVVDILQEQQSVDVQSLLQYLNTNSPEYKNLIQVYTSKFGSDTNSIESNLKRYLQTVTAQKNYFAGKTLDNLGGYSLIPFYDAFALIFSNLSDKQANFAGLVQYIIAKENANTVEGAFKSISDKIAQTPAIQDYTPTDELLIKAKNVLDNQTNKLSQVAIQSLGSDTIHSAVIKIIAKRIPVLDRVMGLKGLVKPFNQSVITPFLQQFKKYTGYKQGDALKNPGSWLKDRLWPKKVPGDFSKMVEDISANNLLNVAVLAYEYYMYLLSTQGKTASAQQSQPVNASLNLFDKFINNILNEEAPPWLQGPTAYQSQEQTPRPAKQRDYKAEYARRKELKAQRNQKSQPQQTQQSGGLPPEQIEKIANEIGNTVNPDYEAFIDGGTSQYLPGVKYDLNTISKDPSREAQVLYRALTDMAYFVRKSVGAKERLKYASQAGAALAGFGGATLYGGPQ